MALSRKAAGRSTAAEISLQHLGKCLVNLPVSLVEVLLNANVLTQNVVIEITYKGQAPVSAGSIAGAGQVQKSAYVGWTGSQSQRRLAPVVSRDGFSGGRGSSTREQEVALVEIDASFAKVLGLSEGQKIGVILHLDPPLAHTINIEPLTPEDWEIIETKANYLELNLLAQIRALPNPTYEKPGNNHPLTLHITNTLHATIKITSLTPVPPASSPFVKLAPDAEVIVAPKARARTRSRGRGNQSVASVGKRSVGGRSTTSTVRHRKEDSSRGALFLRGVDRQVVSNYFEASETDQDIGLRIWLDRDDILSRELRGSQYVSVSIVRPGGLAAPLDPGQMATGDEAASDAVKPALKIVARLMTWEDCPVARHCALSTGLSASLAAENLVGGVIRVEAAPSPYKSSVKLLKIYPFSSSAAKNEGIQFGGETNAEREEAARKIKALFSSAGKGRDGVLDGPVTDGLVLERNTPDDNTEAPWDGAVLRFEPPPSSSESKGVCWLLGAERKIQIEVQQEILRPSALTKIKQNNTGELLPNEPPVMVGIDNLLSQAISYLGHSSSVLLTGGQGSGKTSLAQLVAHKLTRTAFFNITYFSCRKLVTEEVRVSQIKETLNRMFLGASWGARLGGKAVVILDDIDKLCPVETELQVGGENGRSRQISEGVCSIVRQYCSGDSGVVLLATAQGKESLNNIIVGGHVFREMVAIKAPDKERRRRTMEMLVNENLKIKPHEPAVNGISHRKLRDDSKAWMDGESSSGSSHTRNASTASADGFSVDPSIDFLDIAGQTDGYMPGDLVVLVARARSEALVRIVEQPNSENSSLVLTAADFKKALDGFTPASLRNVTLQSSTTTFASIGGLKETRQVLLETLQYPTTYAPIFEQCTLRLRSGLLLYGYPGCGKTMLASAVAGECGLNFISVKGPEILNKYIGASEKSVRDLFERAEAAKPCVLFFDEFDSVAPKRGHDSTGVTDRVVNQLLTQMDGAEGLSGVYVLAATSRPDLIDPALLRPGRLDKSLICDLPNQEDRVDILQALSKKLKLAPEVLDINSDSGLSELARRTEGYSGADLQAVVYNASLEAIHELLDKTMASSKSQRKGSKSSKAHEDDGMESEAPTPVKASRKSTGQGKEDQKRKHSKKQAHPQEFITFPYEGEQDPNENRDKRALLRQRNDILEKLAGMKNVRVQQKALLQRHYDLLHPAEAASNKASAKATDSDESRDDEPVIYWRHISKALETTKASISADERKRLGRIYQEFVGGRRSGEIPGPADGSAREVGGRVSLM